MARRAAAVGQEVGMAIIDKDFVKAYVRHEDGSYHHSGTLVC